MNDLSAFGKSLQTSLSAAGAELSSVASSTETELMNFGREIGRDGAELGAHMAQGANHMGTSIAAGTRQIGDSLNQLSRERVAWFFALSTVGTLMFSLAFFVGLPTLILAPAKFALCFSIGSACSMSAMGALRGVQGQVTHMMAPERLTHSMAYLGSLLGTLYCALVLHSYVLTIVCSFAQLTSLLYYQVSYFPMGAQGLQAVFGMGLAMVKPIVFACGRSLGLVKQKTFLPI